MSNTKSSGFTLVEALIALAITSVALLTALQAMGVSADSTHRASDRFFASLSAENNLQEVWISPSAILTRESKVDCSQAGLTLECERRVFPTPHPNFLRVEVVVRDKRQVVLTKRIAFYSIGF
jgi:general secretion pathway protein I